MNFAYVPHRSYLLQTQEGDESFFVSGDAVFDPQMAESVRAECAGKVAVFVTAYQLIEKPSREFLEALSPDRIILIHQPREEDPASASVSTLAQIGIKDPPGGILVETPEPMSWIM